MASVPVRHWMDATPRTAWVAEVEHVRDISFCTDRFQVEQE